MVKYTKVVRGSIGVLGQRFKKDEPIAQNTPEKKPKKSPIFRGWFDLSASHNNSIKPKIETKIDKIRDIVNFSPSQMI